MLRYEEKAAVHAQWGHPKVSVNGSSVDSETTRTGNRPRTLAKKPCLTYIELMIEYRIIKQTMTNHFEIMTYTF